jgi:hypothetical protein
MQSEITSPAPSPDEPASPTAETLSAPQEASVSITEAPSTEISSAPESTAPAVEQPVESAVPTSEAPAVVRGSALKPALHGSQLKPGLVQTVLVPAEPLQPVAETAEKVTMPVAMAAGEASCMVSAKVYNMAAAYGANADQHASMGHDAGAFAYSCTSGDALENVTIGPNGDARVRAEVATFSATVTQVLQSGILDHLPEGAVIGISGAAPGEDFFSGNHHHFMVKSTDEGPAIFASKLHKDGPVVFSGAEGMVTMFDGRTIGIARKLWLEHKNKST